MTDDQTYDDLRTMPLVQRELVRQGTSFNNAFASTPLCCPSRATFLRGQYEHNHTIVSNAAPTGGYVKFRRAGIERSTVATWLHDANYRTVLLGKYLNEYDTTAIPKGWDEWYARTHGLLRGGTGFQLSENGKLRDYPFDKYHATDVLRNRAVDYIRRGKGSNRPFFMYLAVKAPHAGPVEIAPRHQGTFKNTPLPRPPNFNEADVSDKPSFLKRLPRFSGTDLREISSNHRQRLRSLQAVDEMVAALTKTVGDVGELNNTYFLFVSDNGFHEGEHRYTHGKGTPYEESIKVPFVVRGPEVPKDRTLNHLVLNNDFAPTVADLARATTPSFVDGKSLRPLLRPDPPSTSAWRDQILVEHVGRANGYRAVRTLAHKYVEYENGEKELYDLARDPFELRSIDENSPALVTQMKARLAALRGCAKASCREAENPSPAGIVQPR